MDMERLNKLLEYFSLLKQTPSEFSRLNKVADAIEKELKVVETRYVMPTTIPKTFI